MSHHRFDPWPSECYSKIMSKPNKVLSTIVTKFGTDPEFKEHFLKALKADKDKVAAAVEKLLKSEGIEIDSKAHQLITEINWHTQNIGEELRKRITTSSVSITQPGSK